MGVPRLLVLLAGIATQVKVGQRCRSARLGIDLFGWLHQAVVNHYDSLVVQKPPDYRPVVDEVLDRARIYLARGIHPLFVLDGRRLPGKEGTDEERARKRLLASQAIDDALAELTEEERDAVEKGEAELHVEEATLKAAAAVNDGLITAVIAGLRKLGLAYVKAPYEADTQLVALDRLDIIQFVETVDSDLIVGRCRRVLTKVNPETGDATLYEMDKITAHVPDRDATSEQPLLKLTRRWGPSILLAYAMLAGCDYLKIPGYGPKTALKILTALRFHGSGITPEQLWTKARALHRQGGQRVPDPGAKAEFIKALTSALACYESQIVYNPKLKKDMPLHEVAPTAVTWERLYHPLAQLPDCCGQPSTGTVTCTITHTAQTDIPGSYDGEQQVSLGRAQAHALGFFNSRDSVMPTPVALPEATQAVRPGTDRTEWLTTDMVPGAIILADHVSEAAIAAAQAGGRGSRRFVTTAQMRLFLATRSYQRYSDYTWEQLARAVQQQLKLEADAEATAEASGVEPPMQYIRDPGGSSVLEYLLDHELVTVEDFPQGDGDLTAPGPEDGGWVTNMDTIPLQAPMLSKKVFDNHFAPIYGMNETAEEADVRAVTRGYAHLEGLTNLEYFAFHPAPVRDRPEVVAIRMKVRASYKQSIYLTTAWLEVDMASTNDVKEVQRVLKAQCKGADGAECKASGSSHRIGYGCCTHCSCTLQVLRNLRRPESLAINRTLIAKTSELCRWNKPSNGEHYDIKVPVWTISFTGPDPNREQPRRPVVCLQSMATNATLNPVPEEMRSQVWRDGPRDLDDLFDMITEDTEAEEAEAGGRYNLRQEPWHHWQKKRRRTILGNGSDD